jgi:hypothetical protein
MEDDEKALEHERAMQTMEQLRGAVEKGYRNMQESGDDTDLKRAQMRFKVRMKAIQTSQPEAFKEWQAGNARFLQAMEQGKNPILC